MSLRDLGNSREAWQARVIVWTLILIGCALAAWIVPGDPTTDAAVIEEQHSRAHSAGGETWTTTKGRTTGRQSSANNSDRN